MINWTLFSNDFSDTIKNVNISIMSDYYFPKTTDIYSSLNTYGSVYVDDGIIKMNSQGPLAKRENIDILIKLPKDTYNTSSYFDNNFEYYYNKAQGSSTFVKVFVFIVIFLLCFISLTLLLVLTLKANKQIYYLEEPRLNFKHKGNKLPKLKDIPYYRDIPCNNDLFLTFYIAYQFFIIYRKTDLLGSILLKWLRDKKIEINKTENSKTNITFYKDNLDTISDTMEKELYNMFLLASNDGILEQSEFSNWCMQNHSKVLGWFNNLLNIEKEKLLQNGLLIEKNRIFFKSKKYIVTPKLRQLAMNIAGLKRYLLDYTLVSEKEAPQVILFEDYLILAEMFKITDTIKKDFKYLFPNMVSSAFQSIDISQVNNYANEAMENTILAQREANMNHKKTKK